MMTNFTANWHTHTFRCKHATGDAIDYARAAVAAGLTTLGFSDHMPTPDNTWPTVRMELSQLPGYCRAVEAARQAFPQLAIFCGLECEYLAEWRSFYEEELLGRHKMEYLILGAHFMWHDGELASPFFEKCATPSFLRTFVGSVCAAIESGFFRAIAHPDLFGASFKCWNSDTAAAARDIIQAARTAGLPLEINTYGLRKPYLDTPDGTRPIYPWHPFWEIVAEEKAAGVIWSDAHNPADIAGAVAEAYALAQELGIRIISPADLDNCSWRLHQAT